MGVRIGKKTVGLIVGRENLTPDLNNQDRLLNDLEADINKLPEASGGATRDTYTVKVIDYDGTVLKEEHLKSGEVFTLPDPPTRDRLVFQEWVSPVTITDNTITVTSTNIVLGPCYTTASGCSEFDVEMTEETGLTATIKFASVGEAPNQTTVDWGDGNSETITDLADLTKTHTYADYGNYTILVGGLYEFAEYTFGQSSTTTNKYITEIRLSSKPYELTGSQKIPRYAFGHCKKLRSASLSNGVTSTETYIFAYSALKSFIVPPLIKSLNSFIFSSCNYLKSVVLHKDMTKFPTSITLQSCRGLSDITVPENITTIDLDLSWSGLTNFTIPDWVTKVVLNGTQYKDVFIPESVTNLVVQNIEGITEYSVPHDFIEDFTINMCKSLKYVKNTKNARFNANIFNDCYNLEKVKYNPSDTNLQSGYRDCYSLKYIDFSEHTRVPTCHWTGSSQFSNVNPNLKIYVPDALYDDWIVGTNWTLWVKYIRKASEMPSE